MVRVGVGQENFRIADPVFNLGLVQSLLEKANQAGVEILVLPELANSGYTLQDKGEAATTSETIPEGPMCRMLAQWSRGNRLVVGGICEKAGDQFYNSAPVFAYGSHLTTYRKAHLFAREPVVFSAGNEEPPVIVFGDYKIGVLICYDWAFPEMARILALDGAQILLHPSNLVLPYGQSAMVIRSIENRVFTATANRFGRERGVPFSGRSQIVSPQGEMLAQATGTFTGVLTADIDLTQADNKMVTSYNHLFRDRKPRLYRRITETGDKAPGEEAAKE